MIYNLARPIILYAELTKRYHLHAARYVACVKRFLCSKAINGIPMLHEAISRKKDTISIGHIMPFGCTAHGLVHDKKRKKMDLKGECGI